jgi:hypothetical protein
MMIQISNQEMWRRAYAQRPYLQFSSEQEIAARLRYLMENITTLLPDGKVGVLPPEPHGKMWIELFQNVLDEYARRSIQPPKGFLKDAHIPRPTYPTPPAAVKALEGISRPPEGTYLVKYGKREHISELYKRGSLRITPASFYRDPSLNDAIQDDELTLSSQGLQSETQITFVDKAGQKHTTSPIGNITRRVRSIVDYYVYCMSTSIDYRLFHDFGYDACVIVRNHAAFEDRLSKAVAARLPNWIGSGGAVNYLDPFTRTQKDLEVFHGKHHKYWYQREYRCVWTPREVPETPLKPFFLELGSMHDIGQLVVLDGA